MRALVYPQHGYISDTIINQLKVIPGLTMRDTATEAAIRANSATQLYLCAVQRSGHEVVSCEDAEAQVILVAVL